MLSWQTANVSDLPQFLSTFEDSKNGGYTFHEELRLNLKERVNSLLRSFCSNLNCVQAECPTHGKQQHAIVYWPHPSFLKVTNTRGFLPFGLRLPMRNSRILATKIPAVISVFG